MRVVVWAAIIATVLALAPLRAPGAEAQQNQNEIIIMGLDTSKTPDDTAGLLLISPDGQGFRRLATSSAVRTFDVSPNGKWIVYATESGELWSIGIDGKNDQLVLSETGVLFQTPVIGAGGTWLYYVAVDTDIGQMWFHALNRKTGTRWTERMSTDPEARMHRMHRSPSGRYLLVVPTSLFIGVDDGGTGILYEIAEREASLLDILFDDPVWLPDDRILASAIGDYAIYDPRADTYFEPGADLDWRDEGFDASPDGERAIELVVERGETSLDVVALEAGDRTLLSGIPDELFGEGQVRWVTTPTNPNPRLCEGWVITKQGGRNANKVKGSAGGDVIDGGGKGDRIDGGAGNDVLCGGSGNDRLIGGKGDDILFGGNGRDKLSGKGGNDRLFGGRQSDKLFGGSGNDLLDGELGDDKGDGGSGFDRCTEPNYTRCEP